MPSPAGQEKAFSSPRATPWVERPDRHPGQCRYSPKTCPHPNRSSPQAGLGGIGLDLHFFKIVEEHRAVCDASAPGGHGTSHFRRCRHRVVKANTLRDPQRPILLVDDEAQALTSFEMALRSARMSHFISCHDSRDVLPVLAREDIEVMLLDLWMPHVSGEELLQKITADYPDLPVIIITGADDVETAVRCMRQGAFDYIVKPVEKSRLVSSVQRAVELRELHRENQSLKARVLSDRLNRPEAFEAIVTVSPGMRSIFQYVEAVAPSPRPLLITGDTGVGKELVARAVHTLSNRKGAFVPVNVAGLDDHVFADTLFGHKRGAFTGPWKRGQAAGTGRQRNRFLDESAISTIS
jgi:FixJ family two-component response regulator